MSFSLSRVWTFCIVCFSSIQLLHAQKLLWLLEPTDTVISIHEFSEGLAKISFWNDESLKYLDTSGNILTVQGPYVKGGDFHEGHAWVAIKNEDEQLRYGFIDKAGKLVIPCIYEAVQDYSSHLAAVKLSGNWLYINQKGKTLLEDPDIIKASSVKAESSSLDRNIQQRSFRGGRLLIKGKNGLYGYVDSLGSVVIKPEYPLARDFNQGVAFVFDTVPLPEIKGDDILSRLYNSLPSGPPEYRTKIIDKTGRVLFREPENRSIAVMSYHDGNLTIRREEALSRKWGVIDTSGKVIIPAKFSHELLAGDGSIYLVQVDGHQESNNKDGYILTFDKKGKQIAKIPFESDYGVMYDSNLGFYEGLLGVKIDDRWGYVDAKGDFLIPPQFRKVTNFKEGFAVVRTLKGEIGVLKKPIGIQK